MSNRKRNKAEDASPSSLSPVTSLRTTGTASTPDIHTKVHNMRQYSRETNAQKDSSAERRDAKPVSHQNQALPTQAHKERSSSYGASWTTSPSEKTSSQLSNTGFSLNREPSETYRSTKSTKDDGFKIPTQHVNASRVSLAAVSANGNQHRMTALSKSLSGLPGPVSEQKSLQRVASEARSRSLQFGPAETLTPASFPQAEDKSHGSPDGLPARTFSPAYTATAAAVEEDKPQGRELDQSPSREGFHSKRMSRHVREAALSQFEGLEDVAQDSTFAARKQSSGLLESPMLLDSSPERFRQWRETMEGIIDGEGVENDLPRELGISAASLTLAPVYPVKQPPTEAQVHSTSFAPHVSMDAKPTNGKTESAVTNTVIPSSGDRRSSLASTQCYRVAGQTEEKIGLSVPKVVLTTPENVRKEQDDAFPLLLKRGSLAIAQPKFAKRGISWGAMAGTMNAASSDIQAHSDTVASDELELQAKELAAEMFDGNEEHVPKDKVAEYLGGLKPLNRCALKHYMGHFNFANLRLDEAFRVLCGKLYLRAESQEIDRILGTFSERYFECNPNTIFGDPGTIHTVTGSFLLLNTDLHIAELSSHMSRTQFVKLTLETLNGNRVTGSPMSSTSELDLAHNHLSMSALGSAEALNVAFKDGKKVGANNSVNPSAGAPLTLPELPPGSPQPLNITASESRNRISSSNSMGSIMTTRGRETELESALRDIYASVKSNRILLPVANSVEELGPKPDTSLRGTWESKRNSLRGVSSVYQQSVKGRASPAPSQALSFARDMPTLGFVSNLAHTVIKEQEDELTSIHSAESIGSDDELTDDQLALMGAPWAKEGNLVRKLYWESPGKRNKDKAWKETFAVLQEGEMQMFAFGEGSKPDPGSAVGGGNWLTNARATGDLNLSHALASALPPPGYNTSRPHCFSLTLPTGEMDFFQAGTEELVQEWVSTCNYWAARRSRPPLPGGVTNAEYGWRSLESQTDDKDDTVSLFSNKSSRSKLSFQGTISRRNNSMINIADWQAPQPSLIPSQLDEEAQLESLRKHLEILVNELKLHKTYQEALNRLYPPRSNSLVKAKENWRNKSLHIHTEIVKYGVYSDSLRRAIALRLEKQGERKLHDSLQIGNSYGSDENDGLDDDDDDDLPYEEG
ncbi:hypothetical protein QFC21_005204 [Naganishia friedmannii]|uniref:Uncharacterized protein n=1 Tax=Naganishia friedmannii TaxID=89922 RepID=A0ACC2VAR1_9TREE|nr:hypothetical protein QFC21_005204 [Naganishia friedmannii]